MLFLYVIIKIRSNEAKLTGGFCGVWNVSGLDRKCRYREQQISVQSWSKVTKDLR